MNKDIKHIIIGCVILLVPIIFAIKRSVAIELQRKAIEAFQLGTTADQSEKAIAKINLAIKLAPRNYVFYVTKAHFLETDKRHSEAIDELKHIHKYDQNYAEGYVAIGRNYESLGYIDSAQTYYHSALKAYDFKIDKLANKHTPLFYERINKACVYNLLNDTVNLQLDFKLLKQDYPEHLEVIEQLEPPE